MSYASLEKTAFELAHASICSLIDRFEKYARDTYLLSRYSEAAARTDFIDPLLKALNREIDTPVYEVYGLTDDEIALVEGNA